MQGEIGNIMELLTIGPPHTIADTTARALPARATRLAVQFVSATTINFSNSSSMANPVALTTSAFAPTVPVAHAFMQVIGGTAIARLGAE